MFGRAPRVWDDLVCTEQHVCGIYSLDSSAACVFWGRDHECGYRGYVLEKEKYECLETCQIEVYGYRES